MGGFHMRSSPPCWWTKTKDRSLVPFVRPPTILHYGIVNCVSRDWLQTTNWFATKFPKRLVLTLSLSGKLHCKLDFSRRL